MRWCFGIGAVHLGTSAQTQVASGYFGVLWQYPSALVLAVRDMLGKASRTLSCAADKHILMLQALPHGAPSTGSTAFFPTYMHKKMIHNFFFFGTHLQSGTYYSVASLCTPCLCWGCRRFQPSSCRLGSTGTAQHDHHAPFEAAHQGVGQAALRGPMQTRQC